MALWIAAARHRPSEERNPLSAPANRCVAWFEQLCARLATDDDFRRMFERTPGKAAHSIGVPYDELEEFIATMPTPITFDP